MMARSFTEADQVTCFRVDMPTLLRYGDEDVRAVLAVAENLHRAIPWSELVVMPASPHSSVEASESGYAR
jgi:pimeloyl-ACP methyl ester carboxylesterase